MTDAMLILLGGLLGSAHCIGMCGGFVLTLGSSAGGIGRNLLRQTVYAGGRISVYAFAGALVGYGGARLGREYSPVFHFQAILSMLAGFLLIAEGIFSLGLIRRPFAGLSDCPGASVLAAELRSPRLDAVFAAGMVNGLLPCGLVYAYLALAGSQGNVFAGALVMAIFGLGTVPAMVLTGLSGSLLSLTWRKRVLTVAAWCMIASGLLALWRGSLAFRTDFSENDAPPTCPLCDEADADK